MATMKVHKSVRIDSALSERIDALSNGGETATALYIRVLEAGVTSLETGDVQSDEANATAGALEVLERQLAVKDEQIVALGRIAEAAQTLHAIETTTKELPATQPNDSGFGARMRFLFTGRIDKEQ